MEDRVPRLRGTLKNFSVNSPSDVPYVKGSDTETGMCNEDKMCNRNQEVLVELVTR